MGQLYMQRFAYRDGCTKAAIDEAWGNGFKAVARTGNWGGAMLELCGSGGWVVPSL